MTVTITVSLASSLPQAARLCRHGQQSVNGETVSAERTRAFSTELSANRKKFVGPLGAQLVAIQAGQIGEG